MSLSSLVVTWSWLEASLAMASSMLSILVLDRFASAMVVVLNESTKCYGPRVRGLGVLQKREIKERKFFIVLLAFYYIFDSYI